MKRLTTKELLFLSLEELNQTQPLSKITISQIVKNCGFKRGTFYYYFKDKEDLVQSSVSDAILQIHQKYYPEGSWLTVLEHSLQFSENHRQLFRDVHDNQNWFYTDFLSYIEEYILSIATSYYKKKYNTKPPIPILAAISFYCAGSIRLYQEWICSNNPLSVSEMAMTINNLVPDCLQEVLNGGSIQ